MFRFRPLLVLLALALCPLAQAQITTQPSPACAKPVLTVPVGANITLTWVAPTKNADGSTISGAITYNLYSLAGANPVSLLTGITTTSTVRSNLSVGTPCYAVSSSVAGIESTALSNTASISVVSTPLPPTGLTCTIVIPAGGAPVTGSCTTQ